MRKPKRKRLAHEKLESRQLLAVDGFAPTDGAGNNLANPDWGTVGEDFIRLAPAVFEDGDGTPARRDEANAREISNLISAQEESIENDRSITPMWFHMVPISRSRH